MKIQYSPYSLKKKTSVNALDHSTTQEGCLIKVIDSENHWGVADLSPWPALGDSSLQDEIKNQGLLYQRSVQLATEDLKARKEKKSLLQNKWVLSNQIIPDYKNFNFQKTKQVLKIKGDSDVDRLAKILNSLSSDFQIRLDFNACLSHGQFQNFLDLLQNKKIIQYIEDPTAYDELSWKKWNQQVPLASDFVKATKNFTYKIVKPSREQLTSGLKYTITSAMDHPVGVAHALRYAQSFAENTSGMMTLGLYEETSFHKYFIYQNDLEINFSAEALQDFGIGMTTELEKCNWKNSL